MKTLKEIKHILNKHKPELFKKYPLKNIAVFGSYSRNEQKPVSDVDIMVEFTRPVGIRFIDLAEELEQLLGIKVDLVSRNGIKPKYYQSIKSDLIYV